MNWFLSILIGLLTAVVGCIGAFYIAERCVRWYRISSFEGAAGYYVVMLALLGLVAGLVVGIVVARMVAAGTAPSLLKGMGAALGTTAALLVATGTIAWLAADLAPTLDGRPLELAIEIRGPVSFTIPADLDGGAAFARVELLRGAAQPFAPLRVDEAELVDGHWVVPATVPLVTSKAHKLLRAHFAAGSDHYFPLALPRRPSREAFAWSDWAPAGWDAASTRPAADASLHVRYRVQYVPLPPPRETHAQAEAREAAQGRAEFDALAPDAPITEWLRYTRYGTPDDVRRVAHERITDRLSFLEEMSDLVRGADSELAAEALRLIVQLPDPPPELNPLVTAVGRSIAESIRRFNDMPVSADPDYRAAADISVRFSAWMTAVRALRGRNDGDFTPELREILELSRVRSDSQALRSDVLRVASCYMHEWTGLAPLPTDPKPGG